MTRNSRYKEQVKAVKEDLDEHIELTELEKAMDEHEDKEDWEDLLKKIKSEVMRTFLMVSRDSFPLIRTLMSIKKW